MADYRPSFPFNVTAHVLKPIYTTVKGSPVKVYPEPDESNMLNCSFKTFGGTERESNGVYSVEDTANVETWYRPDIQADCEIFFPGIGAKYEILGTPENISMRNQFLKMKLRRITGGA